MSAFVISNRLNQSYFRKYTIGYKLQIQNLQAHQQQLFIVTKVNCTLENSSTSLDVRLTSNVRSSSSVKVYFRVLGAEQDENY